MSRFYLFFLLFLPYFLPSYAHAQNEIVSSENDASVIEPSEDSEEKVSELSIAPVPQETIETRATDIDIFKIEELDFKQENDIEKVYTKDGKLFSGAVQMPNEDNEEMTFFYKNGQKNGMAVAYDSNHKIIHEISYENGLQNGIEILFYPTGKPQYQRNYKDGLLNGEEITFYESGKPKERRNYANGLLNGEIRYLDENGNLLKIENYKNNIKEGSEQIIENNFLKQENTYVNGKLDGVIKKFNEKYLIEEIEYKNGVQNGIQKIYSEKGDIQEIPYTNGKREGLAQVYYPNKQPAQRVQYFNNQKNGLNEKFYQNGIRYAAEYYKNGNLDGISRYFDEKGYLTTVKYYVNGTEMAVVDLTNDIRLKRIYEAYKKGKLGNYGSKRNLWYSILWLALNTEQQDILLELEKEMKMFTLLPDNMDTYKKYSEDYEELERQIYFGLTPFSYAVNLSAPVDTLQRFVSQIDIQNERGTTALQEAIRLNNANMVKYLLLQKSNEQNIDNMLFYALKNQVRPEIIEMLLQQHTDTSATDENGDTPLLYALKHQPRPETVLLLLKAGFDVSATDKKGNSPITYAIKNKMPDTVIKQMLQNGANLETIDATGNTVLIYAVKHNYEADKINDLLQLGADVNSTDADGYTPLALAISQNREDIVDLLVHAGADINAHINTSPTGQVPILLFAYLNQASPQIINTLLSSGANINLQDADGNTLILEALRRQDAAFAQTLLNKGADVNLVNADGENALTYIIMHPFDTELQTKILAQNADLNQKIPANQTEIWRYLLQTGNNALIKAAFDKTPDIAALKDKEGLTPIDEVMSGQYSEEIKNMVLAYVSKTNEDVLQRALNQDDPEVLKQVLDLNKDPQKLRINDETLAGYIIKNKLNPAHLEVLAQIGIDFNEPDATGQTALGLCVAENEAKYVPYLLKHGANVNQIVSDKSYLMTLQGSQADLTALLLEQNPDISHITQNGETVLMAAVKNINMPLIEYILEQGADLNATDNDGNNALMYLAEARNMAHLPQSQFDVAVFEIGALLLQTSIDANRRNVNGETALILLAKHNPDIYQTLRPLFVEKNAALDLKDQYGKTADQYFEAR